MFCSSSRFKVPGLGFGLPWAGLVVGWHPATVPPNCVRSGKSHRAHRAASSGAYRSPPHDGCTATGGCSETSRGRCERIPDPCGKQTAGRRWMQQIAPAGQSRAGRGGWKRSRGATHGRRNSERRWASAGLPSKRLLCRHKHGNSFPVFAPLWFPNMRPFFPPAVLPVGPLLNSPFSAWTPATSPCGGRWHSPLFFTSCPGVNFLSCPVSDPEHSLPRSNRRHRSWRLLPPAPPLDVPQARHDAGVEDRGGPAGYWEAK